MKKTKTDICIGILMIFIGAFFAGILLSHNSLLFTLLRLICDIIAVLGSVVIIGCFKSHEESNKNTDCKDEDSK